MKVFFDTNVYVAEAFPPHPFINQQSAFSNI